MVSNVQYYCYLQYQRRLQGLRWMQRRQLNYVRTKILKKNICAFYLDCFIDFNLNILFQQPFLILTVGLLYQDFPVVEDWPNNFQFPIHLFFLELQCSSKVNIQFPTYLLTENVKHKQFIYISIFKCVISSLNNKQYIFIGFLPHSILQMWPTNWKRVSFR